MWSFPDEPWQYRVLDALPPGIDHAQLARAKLLTPTERVEAMIALAEAGAALQVAVRAAKSAR